MIREKRIIFRRTPLDIPLLIFLGFGILSLGFSIDPRISWFGYYSRWNGGLQSLITYSFLYWAFVSNMTKKDVVLGIRCSVFGAVIVSIYGILEHFGHSISCLLVTPSHSFDVSCWVQDVQNRVYATLGQPNWMAAYLVSLIFIPISSVLGAKGQGLSRFLHSTWHIALSTILFIALLFTKSRSGLLAFGIASAVFWGMQLSKKALLPMALFAALVSTLLISFQNPIRDLILHSPQPSALSTGTSLETGGTESGNIRKIVWTGAIRIWLGSAKNFLIGTGPETFALSYYQYRPIEHNATSEWELLYNKAHNEFLNQLATTGILGLISYLVLLGIMGLVFIKTIYGHRMTMNDNRMTTALSAGWVSILVTNFLGFSVVITQIFLFLFPAVSVVISNQSTVISNEKKKDMGGKQILAIIVVLISTFYFLFTTFQYWNNDRLYAQGQNYYRYFAATNKSEYLFSALDVSQKAFMSGKEPAMAIDFANYAALISSALIETNSTAAAQLAKISNQASAFVQNASPANPSYLRSIAKSQIILNEYSKAYQTLLLAKKLSPTDPKIPYSLGIVSLGLDSKEDAKKYFEEAVLLKPDWPDPQTQLSLLK
jgi:O-antigen ligase